MDSSLKNPRYAQWHSPPPPSAPFPLLPLLPPPPPPNSHQFHLETPNCHDRSRQSDFHHLNNHNYTHSQDFPPKSTVVNQPPSYYSFQPPPRPPRLPVGYESPWISQPSCTESGNFSQPCWVGYMGDYGNSLFTRDLAGNSRFRDRYARKEFGEFQSEADRYCRSLGAGTSFGYGNVPHGCATLQGNVIRNQRLVETPKDDYYLSEIEPYLDNGRIKGVDESNRTTKKPRQEEKMFNSFRSKDHSDYGSVEKQRMDRKETSCTAGKVIFGDVTKKEESFSQPTLSDFENLSRCSEGGVPLQSQPCEDETPTKDMDDLSSRVCQMEEVIDNSLAETNTTTRVDSLDRIVVSQPESKKNSESENGVNSSVETVSRKEESMETAPLSSTAKVDHNLGSDAGKYTCLISISLSPKNVAGKGSSIMLPVEKTSVLLHSICTNEDARSNRLVLDREVSSAMCLEDVSSAPNQVLDLSSHDLVDIPAVDQSGFSESNVSLSKDTNVGASEFHLNQEVREKSPTCDKFPCSSVMEVEDNLTIGNMGSSGSKMVTDSDTQSCSAGCKFLPHDLLGCGASDVVGSFLMSSMDKDQEDDPLRSSSCLVPDSSLNPCHHSPSVSMNEQMIQNSASSVEANCSSRCSIIEKEMSRAENMDVDIQEEKERLTGETSQCRTLGTDCGTVSADPIFQCGSSSSSSRLIIRLIQNQTHAVAKVDKTNNSSHCGIIEKEMGRAENMDVDIQEEKERLTGETLQCRTIGTDCGTVSVDPMFQCGSSSTSSRLIIRLRQNQTNAAAKVDKTNNSKERNKEEILLDVSQEKIEKLTDGTKSTLSSVSEKIQKRANKGMHAAQKSFPRSLYDTKENAKPPINVTNHSTWHRNSNTSASPLVAVKPKLTVQSSNTYVRKENSLLRKPSPGSLGEAQTLRRHSGPVADSTSGNCALSPDFQPKQNPLELESSNSSKLLYVKRKPNQLVAASDIHGASNSGIPPSGGYFKRSKNQLVRNSESLPNQAKPLSDDALDSHTAARIGSKRSSSSAFPESAAMRPFNQSKFSYVWRLKEPLSRKANRVHISPQKIISRKLLMMRKRRSVYRRSTNGGGSHFKWSNSSERDSKKREYLSDVEPPCSSHPESLKETKKSFITNRLVISNDKSVWIRNGNQLVRDPKKRTRVLANEKVRWSLQNVRSRSAKEKIYCQFFTRFGKCSKDDGKCLYIHDPSKIAVCTKFLSGLCDNPDCKLTHKVVPESMPDCYYFLQGLCNNESCPYRHVHVHPNAAICEGFLRGYCSDGNECRKKHTYTCPVFEAAGSCPQGSECKLHHPKNISKGKKRKTASEPWQKNARGRYFDSLQKDLPESEPMLVNELATTDGAVFGREGSDFIRLDFNEHEDSESMDSSPTESVSDDSEAYYTIDELIRPVGLMS